MQCLLDSAVSWDGIADAQRMLTFFFFTSFLPISFHLMVCSTISQVLNTKSSPAGSCASLLTGKAVL